MWIPPKPSLHIWSNTSMWAGGDSTDHGSNFQHIWTEREKGNYINFLELRAAGLALSKLESTGKVVQCAAIPGQHNIYYINQETRGNLHPEKAHNPSVNVVGL